jgi:hypothetical protein
VETTILIELDDRRLYTDFSAPSPRGEGSQECICDPDDLSTMFEFDAMHMLKQQSDARYHLVLYSPEVL